MTNPWGNAVGNILLQRILYSYGVPYSSMNKVDSRLSIVETELFPSEFNDTVHKFMTMNTTISAPLPRRAADMSIAHFILPHPLVNQSYNVQAFKYYWNHNHETDKIVDQDSNILDADTQTKLLTKTPLSGFGAASCEDKCSPLQYLDIVFIIDGSGSVMWDNFQKELAFVANMTSQLPVSQDLVRVGFIVYSTNLSAVYDLKAFSDHESLNATLMSTSYPAQYTYTGLALAEAMSILTDDARGARGPLTSKLIVCNVVYDVM